MVGLALIGRDERLQAAIRRTLAGGRPASPTAEDGRRPRRNPAGKLAALSERRRKLLDLYYEDGISRELFSEEEKRLSAEIEAVRAQAGEIELQDHLHSELVLRFEQVAALLGTSMSRPCGRLPTRVSGEF